jgi:hypothetical protein
MASWCVGESSEPAGLDLAVGVHELDVDLDDGLQQHGSVMASSARRIWTAAQNSSVAMTIDGVFRQRTV